MSQKTHPLDWTFVGDDGFWHAKGYCVSGYKITPSTLPGTDTMFFVERQDGDSNVFESIGVLRSLENAKLVCDLLENG